MSNELTDLHNMIANYALEHSVKEIPRLYFEKTANNWKDMKLKGQDWDKSRAAAALLYAAVVDGIVHQSQMTPQGYRALDWAERYLDKIDATKIDAVAATV